MYDSFLINKVSTTGVSYQCESLILGLVLFRQLGLLMTVFFSLELALLLGRSGIFYLNPDVR